MYVDVIEEVWDCCEVHTYIMSLILSSVKVYVDLSYYMDHGTANKLCKVWL